MGRICPVVHAQCSPLHPCTDNKQAVLSQTTLSLAIFSQYVNSKKAPYVIQHLLFNPTNPLEWHLWFNTCNIEAQQWTWF